MSRALLVVVCHKVTAQRALSLVSMPPCTRRPVLLLDLDLSCVCGFAVDVVQLPALSSRMQLSVQPVPARVPVRFYLVLAFCPDVAVTEWIASRRQSWRPAAT